jgi:tRNA A-37 threonylcarbamoyl transferase component Bud32
MFLDEARLSARLSHPNIVNVYEVGEAAGQYFIAMEYLEGQPLQAVLSKLAADGQPLDETVCAFVAMQALKALHYAHELTDYDGTPLHVVHRDFSPHNLFITYQGEVKLLDFGIAKAALNVTHTETAGNDATQATEQLANEAYEQVAAGKYADGIATYLKAYDISHEATLLLNVATIYDRKLKERALAAEYYRRYSSAPGAEPDRVKKVVERLTAIKKEEQDEANARAAAAAAASQAEQAAPAPASSSATAEPPPGSDTSQSNGSGMRTAGVVIGIAGLAGVGASMVFGMPTRSAMATSARPIAASAWPRPRAPTLRSRRRRGHHALRGRAQVRLFFAIRLFVRLSRLLSGWRGAHAPRGLLTMNRRAALFVATALGVLGGCSTVLGIDADRQRVASIPDSGDDSAPPDDAATPDVYAAPAGWECINDFPPIPNAGDQTLELVFNDVSSASSGTTGKPIVGATMHGCNKLDIDCKTPFSETSTDDGGLAILIAPGGFTGFWEVHANNYTPAILSRTPLIGPELAQQSMANLDLLTAGASLAGISQDPNFGVAIVTALNCQSKVAADIVLEVGKPVGKEQLVYLENNLPSQAATKTDAQSGSALVFNVPAGTLEINAFFAADHHPIRTVNALARIGWVTFVQVRLDQAHRVPLP